MLDTRPARNDLTSRECAKLLGGFLGGLAEMAPIEAVRDAVNWYAQHDDPWALLESINETLHNTDRPIPDDLAGEARCTCGHGVHAHANAATQCNGCGCARFRLDYKSVLP